MESPATKVCRLCFTSEVRLIDIFNELDANFVEIIAEHIGEVKHELVASNRTVRIKFRLFWQVNRSDALPKWVCADCWEKTEDFHRFHRSVRNAQEEYLGQVVKLEIEIEPETESHEITDQLTFAEVITNCDEFIGFADENSTKPNNELDDIDQQETKPNELLVGAIYSEPTAIHNVEKIEAIEEETGNFCAIIPNCVSP